MRIIGGTYKGKKLIAPTTDQIRPTSDRMRESLFNILEHGTGPGIKGSKILDLFAGSGALGIEALSRGAEHVTFVDNDRGSLKLCRQNLALINDPENSSIISMDAQKFINGDFDIILLDPPYRKDMIAPILQSIYDNGMINPNGVIIIEYAGDEKIDFTAYFREIKNRKIGDARFSILEIIKARDLDEKFDNDEDIITAFDLTKAKRPNNE